ncbi:MAG TPA: c-type cytochrome [Campylobacterales bacterium]|nr:c-type cytochrome [Campylobacterales bacterium]
MKKITIATCLAVLLIGCGSDTIKKVDDNKSDPEQKEQNPNNPLEVEEGKKRFNLYCATCHGSDAKGKTGPNIVGVTIEDIAEEIAGNSAMTYMQGVVVEEDHRLIAIYLDELKREGGEDDKFSQEKAELGKRLFFDTNLSLTKTLSCASCHDPLHAFIDARFDSNPIDGALSVGDDSQTLGGRNTPTVAYAKFIPDFLKIDDSTYLGGQFWDGRAKNLKEQAKGPFLDPAEMMMPHATSVVSRVKQSVTYQERFKKLYGADIFNDNDKAYDAIAETIAQFEKTAELSPFDSKYDRSKLPYYHVDHYEMTAKEKLGYKLFFSDDTHCRKCHTTSSNTESSIEIFTNFRYENIGVPKNLTALLARDGHTDKIDLGLGGRADINDVQHYGKFKVPTLRNIAVTAPYMSNGVFKELKTVIKYFDYMAGNGHPLNPETGSPWRDAEVNSTINHDILKTLKPLDDEKIEALESFLKLLTDKKYEGLL